VGQRVYSSIAPTMRAVPAARASAPVPIGNMAGWTVGTASATVGSNNNKVKNKLRKPDLSPQTHQGRLDYS
jgi:hypothetical protein